MRPVTVTLDRLDCSWLILDLRDALERPDLHPERRKRYTRLVSRLEAARDSLPAAPAAVR